MPAAKATARRQSLEKHQDEVIALLLTGSHAVDIAKKYKVHRASVSKFIKRHALELAALNEKVAQQVEDYAIAHQVNRIIAKDGRWQLLEKVRQARANGEQGIETGLVVKRYKLIGYGKDAQVVEEYEIDTGLLAAMDRLERGAAEELDQLPKAGKGDTNVNVGVIIKQIEGYTGEIG